MGDLGLDRGEDDSPWKAPALGYGDMAPFSTRHKPALERAAAAAAAAAMLGAVLSSVLEGNAVMPPAPAHAVAGGAGGKAGDEGRGKGGDGGSK